MVCTDTDAEDEEDAFPPPSLPLHVCPWLCPSGNAFLTASCQEGPGNQPHEGEPGPLRDAKDTRHAHIPSQTDPRKHLYRYGRG